MHDPNRHIAPSFIANGPRGRRCPKTAGFYINMNRSRANATPRYLVTKNSDKADPSYISSTPVSRRPTEILCNFAFQPMGDLINILGGQQVQQQHQQQQQQQQKFGNVSGQMAPLTPQTPSSVPDIIFTGMCSTRACAYIKLPLMK